MVSGVGLLVYRLRTRRAHVIDGGDGVALGVLDRRDDEHEPLRHSSGLVRQPEIPCCGLGEHRRRERAERLTELDLRVHDVLHLSPSRIGKDASIAQSARPPLETALEPSDDLAVHDAVDRRRVDQRVLVLEQRPSVPRPLDSTPYGVVIVLLAPVGVVHDEPLTVAERAVPGIEGSAERAASVARGRLERISPRMASRSGRARSPPR